jgi:hypothetical protein
MTYEEARALLAKHNQSHLLRFWDKLDKAARAALLQQVATLDFASIGRMQAMLRTKASAAAAGEIRPAQVVELDAASRARAVARGAEELRAGRVGAVLVAGGQGSRLGFEGPKGAFPIGPITKAVLFHFHVRKVLALGRRHLLRAIGVVATTQHAPDGETILTAAVNDPAFTGGIVGLGRRAKSLRPASWMDTLPKPELAAESSRRHGNTQTIPKVHLPGGEGSVAGDRVVEDANY